MGEVVEEWGVWVVGVVAVDVAVVVDAAVVAVVVVAAASAVVVVAVGAVAAADFDRESADFDRKSADVVVAAAVHAEGVGLEV